MSIKISTCFPLLSGQTSATVTENALVLIRNIYYFLCFDDTSPPSKRFNERVSMDLTRYGLMMRYRATGISPHWLTHYGLMMRYHATEIGHHWFRWWLGAWWHQAITWAIADLPSMTHSGMSQWNFSGCVKNPIPEILMKIFVYKMSKILSRPTGFNSFQPCDVL